MQKIHNMQTAVCTIENCRVPVSYFCKREKHSVNGAPRFRVFIIDPDGGAVYETIFTGYGRIVPQLVADYIETDRE